MVQALLHALSCLSGHIDATHCVKFGFCDMQMTVETAAFTPLCDDGKVGLCHVAHEEQDIDVASFPANNRRSKVKTRHFVLFTKSCSSAYRRTCISFLKACSCSGVGSVTLSILTATSPCHLPLKTVPNEPVPILF